jgi:hypothetical protein
MSHIFNTMNFTQKYPTMHYAEVLCIKLCDISTFKVYYQENEPLNTFQVLSVAWKITRLNSPWSGPGNTSKITMKINDIGTAVYEQQKDTNGPYLMLYSM